MTERHKIDVLNDPFKEVHLVQLNEANVIILAETLLTHIEAVFPDETMLV